MKTQHFKHLLLLVLAFSMCFGIVSQQVSAETENVNYTNVTVQEFHDFFWNTTKPTLIDVRTQTEWDTDGFINGA